MLTKIKKIFSALSRSERIIVVIALVVFVISAFTLGNILLDKITRVVPAYGGSYTEGAVGQPSFVNPVIAASDIDKSLVRMVFSKIEDIAEKIEPEEAGRVWRVRLKDGLLWHDGKKLTSDDVLFTVQKIQDADSRSPLLRSWEGILTRRISERELQFNLGVPYAFFETNLKNLYILPKHLFENIPVANWRISELNLQPIGSGPYRFESNQVKSEGFITTYDLNANTDARDFLPFISNFTFKFFPTKEELLNAFNAGRIDGMAGLDVGEQRGIQRPYSLVEFSLPSYYAVFLNSNQNIALKETAVRKALSFAVDKAELVARIFENEADIVNGPIPPASPYYSDTAPSAASADQAIQILEEAGWTLNESGIREKTIKASQVQLELSLSYPGVPFLKATAEALVAAWKRIGAEVRVNEIPLDQIVDGTIKNRDYQMILFGNALNASTDLSPFWHSSERFHPGLNLSLYSNKEVDRLLEEIRQGLQGEKQRDAFTELQTSITEDYPAIFLYSPHYLYATNRDLKGISGGLIGEPADRFLDTRNWHLKTKRIIRS